MTQVPPVAHRAAARVVVGAIVVGVAVVVVDVDVDVGAARVVVGFAAKYAIAELRTCAETPVTRTGLTRSIVLEFVCPYDDEHDEAVPARVAPPSFCTQ